MTVRNYYVNNWPQKYVGIQAILFHTAFGDAPEVVVFNIFQLTIYEAKSASKRRFLYVNFRKN